MSKTKEPTTNEGMLGLAQWVRDELGGECRVEHCAVAQGPFEKELRDEKDKVYWICWLPGNVCHKDTWVQLFDKVVAVVKGRKAVENEDERSEGATTGSDEG
jgi:hypothetical protein